MIYEQRYHYYVLSFPFLIVKSKKQLELFNTVDPNNLARLTLQRNCFHIYVYRREKSRLPYSLNQRS